MEKYANNEHSMENYVFASVYLKTSFDFFTAARKGEKKVVGAQDFAPRRHLLQINNSGQWIFLASCDFPKLRILNKETINYLDVVKIHALVMMTNYRHPYSDYDSFISKTDSSTFRDLIE